METNDALFNEDKIIHELKHFLPAQAPLKDFIHHNTLHAYQNESFHTGLNKASKIFGYKVYLSLEEYRNLYNANKIRKDILEKIISERKGPAQIKEWTDKVLTRTYETSFRSRIGALRLNWKERYHINLDSLVHPLLFRTVCSYLDQGISIWNFPVLDQGFLNSIREIERHAFTSFFRTKKVKQLLFKNDLCIEELLQLVVGDRSLYRQYLFDQQFSHQGWSGMVSAVEDQPATLLDAKKISLHDLIIFELLLEIDALDHKFGEKWEPLATKLNEYPAETFAPIAYDELHEVLVILHEAFEWTYYDEVLAGVRAVNKEEIQQPANKNFQAMFCIDDREASLRRYLEYSDTSCETFATPGFFGVEFFYKPEKGKFHTKLCPAPMNPKHLIKEIGNTERLKVDVHFTKQSHSLFRGWIISQTLGFWSALQLFLNIFKPSLSPATAYSFKHMDKFSKLTVENNDLNAKENGLQIGFTVEEMADRVEGVLRSIGMVKDFAPIVYAVAHGSSSVNNPHFAAYDCGACCGRPGSVNARVFCAMANHPKVRVLLAAKGLVIPTHTEFLGALHDTSRDEILFFDEEKLSEVNLKLHFRNIKVFETALSLNARERSRRFALVNTKQEPEKVHNKMIQRSVSLFEPRPELNHATNALCVIGRRSLTKDLFLDRRAFMNSYDYRTDPDGTYLLNILKPAAPVCGGINLEYFFSRVDNQKLGAGTKLPHNVMGLIGVANGIDGDLRPGLPSQMIEVHDPIRLLMIVEHFPKVVLEAMKKSPETYEWFINEWIRLIVFDPETHDLEIFKDGGFSKYQPVQKEIPKLHDITPVLESNIDNLPVYILT